MLVSNIIFHAICSISIVKDELKYALIHTPICIPFLCMIVGIHISVGACMCACTFVITYLEVRGQYVLSFCRNS